MTAEDGSHSTVVQATNRRGKSIRCRVTCSPLVGTDRIVRGTIVVVVEEPDPAPATS
jgi:two-component system, chemotaxis family, CheB/CheR fusion protein